MLPYIIPFAAYVFSPLLLAILTQDQLYWQIGKIAIVGALLVYFRKEYKMKVSFDPIAILTGIVIFVAWVALEGRYPYFDFLGTIEVIPTDTAYLIARLVASIMIAPIVEEFCTRFFLNRYLQGQEWEKIPIYKFTVMSFIITTLFFGFSHFRWLSGIVAGILLNLLLMHSKKIESCVIAHVTANLALGLYVIFTQSWPLWG